MQSQDFYRRHRIRMLDFYNQMPRTGGKITGLMEEPMRHSNEQTHFETGAKRDTTEGKGRPSLISPVLIHRLGVQLGLGEDHYGADNWMAGMPFRRTADSLLRHIELWLAGDEEEDHLAAIAANTMFLMHFEEAIKNGEMPESLDDRSTGLKKILSSILTSKPTTPKVEHEAESKDDYLVNGWSCCCNCGVQMDSRDKGFALCTKCHNREQERKHDV